MPRELAGLPTTIEELDAAWLTGALRRGGRIGVAEEVAITAIEPLTSGTSYSTKMYRLGLSGAGLSATAILKLPVTGPLRTLIDEVGGYEREVTFYRELARDIPLRMPDALVAELDPSTGDMVLVMEDLAPLTPTDQLAGLTLSQAESALDGLARFHSSMWEHKRLDSLADRFPPLGSARGRAALEQFGQIMTMTWQAASESPGVSQLVRDFGARLPELMPFFADGLGAPLTIVHGELRADNLFFDSDATLILVDFQTVGQGSPLLDVSYLLSQSVPTDLRRGHDEGLVRRYHDGLTACGVTGFPFELAWEQYRLGVAYSLIFPAMAFLVYEQADDRGKALLTEMLARASAAISDNRSLELLPTGH